MGIAILIDDTGFDWQLCGVDFEFSGVGVRVSGVTILSFFGGKNPFLVRPFYTLTNANKHR